MGQNGFVAKLMRFFGVGMDDSVIMIPTEENIVKSSPSVMSKTTRHVTYGKLLQQICNDFQIEYLWYDKICIDQVMIFQCGCLNFRTSSREHDKKFSLANIFPNMFKDMEINYNIDIKALFYHFHRTTGTSDLSVLCFGSNLHSDGTETQVNTMKSHHLPSWTGVTGSHIVYHVSTTTTLFHSPHFICDIMFLHVATKYYMKLSIAPYYYGCFLRLSRNKQLCDQQDAMVTDQKQSMGSKLVLEDDTGLMDWFIFMRDYSALYATHYYQLHKNMGELPPSLLIPESCTNVYYLPVFKKCVNDTNIT
ncbi:hypothetical protein BDA99DRAFT_536996 [Phascolomyces articulosus]|uniref:Uncharacterized protein n=1 Tax=Phascolomyces articulosus TaxID=60185 RepID=A0AAD5PG84_9FUNG|nr:hypothetical protein BDA99DRAFT_536996 [Phascolomyces articulosus]